VIDELDDDAPRWIPDEFVSAGYSLRAMFSVLGQTAAPWVKFLLGSVVPLIVGWIACRPVVWHMLAESFSSDVLSGVVAGLLAFGALIAGFMVSIMLSTGTIELHEELEHEVLENYVLKLKYLLVSQASTLFASVVMTVLFLAWYVAIGMQAAEPVLVELGAAAGAFLVLTLLRACLLPMQIYEIREIHMEDVLEASQARLEKKYEQPKGGHATE